MNGVAGQWFKPFALTIACAVLVSLFVSFSLDPMLSAYWPDPQLEAHQLRNPVARALDRFNVWFDRQADALQGPDRMGARSPAAMVTIAAGTFFAAFLLPSRGLSGVGAAMVGLAAVVYALSGKRWPVPVLAVFAWPFVAAFVCCRASAAGGRGLGFIPDSDRAEFDIQMRTPPGSNLDYMRIKLEELGRVVRSHPGSGLHVLPRSATPPDREPSMKPTFTSGWCPGPTRRLDQNEISDAIRRTK